MRLWIATMADLCLTFGCLTPALAGEATIAAEDTAGDVLSAGFELGVTNTYCFRGIVQETEDFIVQPGVELGFALMKGEGAVSSVGLTLGTWSSLHGGPTGDAKLPGLPGSWYEADVYAGVSVGFDGGLSASMTYTFYASPNGTFAAVDELSFGLAWDDASLWGEGIFGGFQPALTIAAELDNSAFGPNEGVFGEVAVGPSFTVMEGGPVGVTIGVPLAVGLSLADYYEVDTGSGVEDDLFGYLSGGVEVSADLGFLGRRYGEWSLTVSAKGLIMGDNVTAGGDREVFLVASSLGVGF